MIYLNLYLLVTWRALLLARGTCCVVCPLSLPKGLTFCWDTLITKLFASHGHQISPCFSVTFLSEPIWGRPPSRPVWPCPATICTIPCTVAYLLYIVAMTTHPYRGSCPGLLCLIILLYVDNVSPVSCHVHEPTCGEAYYSKGCSSFRSFLRLSSSSSTSLGTQSRG